MTDTLRTALRSAADDAMPVAPGATGRELLARGRRKARRRRASGTAFASFALVAAVGVPLVPSLLSDAEEPAPGPAVGTTSPTDPGPDPGPCASLAAFDGWTLRAAVSSDGKTTAVFTSPDGARWAECQGSPGSLTVIKPTERSNVDPDPGYTWIRNNHWYDDGCETAEGGTCAWGIAGQLPNDVARMTLESADGRTSEADVHDGFFAWHSTVDGIDVFNQPLWATLYDADGDRIDRLNANPGPHDW
jgi:hypothetical protein